MSTQAQQTRQYRMTVHRAGKQIGYLSIPDMGHPCVVFNRKAAMTASLSTLADYGVILQKPEQAGMKELPLTF